MRVAFLSEDYAPWGDQMLPGGCAYYRQILPRAALGIQAPAGRPAWSGMTGFGVQMQGEQAIFGFEVVCMKMMMARWLPHQIKVAQKLGQKIVVDVDDSYDDLHPANKAYHTTDPKNNPIHNRDYHNQILELADLVTVSTPYLYRHYKNKGLRNVAMVRNGVNPEQFKPIPVRDRKPVIGWVGAMGWRSNDVETARAWLPDFLEEHDLQFLHAGHEPKYASFADAAGINPERLLVTDMLPITMYHNLFKEIDIGLVLLADIPFNEAKSNIKGLEYALSNIPFVAQGLPEYRRLARMGVGRIADTPDDWRRHVTSLLDAGVRKREARINRNLTIRDHSIEARALEWREVFSQFSDCTFDLQTVVVPYVHA